MSEKDDTATVEFREISNWPGYQVGNDGSVRSRRDHGLLRSHWHLLNPSSDRCGYLRVRLRNFERARRYLVHRLVLEAFVEPCPDGMQCRHLDGVKTNNSLGNLCWGTPLENADDSKRLGVLGRNCGEVNGRAKLTDDKVREIKSLCKQGLSKVMIAKQFEVHWTRIFSIARGGSWKHVS